MINNTLYQRRRGKICLASSEGGSRLPIYYLASLLKNIEAYGFTFSETLIEACRYQSLDQLTALAAELDAALAKSKGAHRKHKPMYPNFPNQVMKMQEAELYLNAIFHYLTDGQYLPETREKTREPLLDEVALQVIKLGSQEEFDQLFLQIVGANVAMSEQDKEDVAWFVQQYGNEIEGLLPDTIPQKENMAFVAGLLLQYTDYAAEIVRKFCRTATDVLRLAVALSGGDVSLATATRFRSYKRSERALLLSLLEGQSSNITEDMLRWKDRWIRLGERLHPGEFTRRFPLTAEAFRVLRNDLPFPTFNSELEQALLKKRVAQAVGRLASRPGDFARRLDHLLRLGPDRQAMVIEAFGNVAVKVSTPVLLQALCHFRHRNEPKSLRVFFPKGNLAKAYAIPDDLPQLPETEREALVMLCAETLVQRFGELPKLGKVYLEAALADYMVPFAMRSASKSFRTVARGSRLAFAKDCRVLRFFLWWKNGNERTDIDLSAALFDAEFQYKDIVSYYNLKAYGGCHSGDIVDAPEGASEFIDIDLEKVREQGIRYVLMSLNSYTTQPYCDLPECFAGWMARKRPNSGEIYEPKTVQDRFDLTADTRIAIPLIIDVVENRVIWCDMALRRHPSFRNNVAGNLKGIQLTLKALVEVKKPDLYTLLSLHARARGEVVSTPEAANCVFSVENETPFHLEEIASQYMG